MSDDVAHLESARVGSGMRMSVKWSTVALSAIVVALASGTVTAVIASVNDADTLSVVALSLAVLAFVVQIIVFIAQAAAASRQEVQVTEVYGRTLEALAAIQEKAEGTNRAVTTMSDRLLDAVIGKSIAEAQAEGVTSEKLAEDVSERVKELARSASEQRARGKRRVARKRVSDDSMYVLPRGEALAAALAALGQLSGSEMYVLVELAHDQARNGGLEDRGALIGPGLRFINPYSAPHLVELGLVARRRVPWSSEPVFQLTELGKDAGRALLGRAASQSPALMEVRQRFRDYEADLKRRTSPEESYKDIPVEDHTAPSAQDGPN